MITPTEQIRAFIERVKGEHGPPRDMSGSVMDRCWKCRTYWPPPCDALRAVLALEEMAEEVVGIGCDYGCKGEHYRKCSRLSADEALARAAQKIGGER
jgi:hypothetical protein